MVEMEKKNSFLILKKNDISLSKLSSYFSRDVRQTNELPDYCTCTSKPKTHCPAGLRGPPGLEGIPGQKGEQGTAGKPGIDGSVLSKVLYLRECILCPPGSIGEIGQPGKPGLPGTEGINNIIFCIKLN